MRVHNKMTVRGAASITKPGRHSDGGGLYLFVRPNSRIWIFRYTMAGRVHEKGLGPYAEVSLAAARDAAQAARDLLKHGADPLASKGMAGKPMFGECATALIEAKRREWRSELHANQWSDTIAGFCGPIFDKPVDAIDTAAVLEVLKPQWQRVPETASRLRGRIEAVIDHARAHGFIDADRANPARWKGHLDKLLPKRAKHDRGHHAAMDYAQVPGFVAGLREKEAVAVLALEFAILTAARSGEVLGARWSEIELDHRIWTIPGNRMKGGREHRVPLVDRACDIVRLMAQIRESDLVFPGGRRGRPMVARSLSRLVPGYTVHGFRSSFRDWCGDQTNFPREVAEGCLAHASGNAVESAYRRSDALDKRRKLMDAWASFLEGGVAGNIFVIPARSIMTDLERAASV